MMLDCIQKFLFPFPKEVVDVGTGERVVLLSFPFKLHTQRQVKMTMEKNWKTRRPTFFSSLFKRGLLGMPLDRKK